MNCRLVHWFARATLLYAFPGFLFDASPMEKRKQCFTCHNQALPVMALTTARSRGIIIDAENLQHLVEFTADFLAKN